MDDIKKKRTKEAKDLENHYDSLNYDPNLDENQRNMETKKLLELRRLKEQEQKYK